MSEQSPMDRMKEAILKEAPRLSEKDSFQFSCTKDAPCFNHCCADVNIVLTPYDVLRMRKRIGMPSEEFLEKHCIIPFTKSQRIPVILLKMRDNEKKTCPFVTGKGCSIYEDRPWACRMYPVGVASPKDEPGAEKPFFFLIKEDLCKGFDTGPAWTIRSWMDDQGAEEYDREGREFKELTLHDRLLKGQALDPSEMEQFFMVCYNHDAFRRFVFQSTFLKK
ncbi:MAG: YkgJ family cysteine cluster protein, partial [Planctomycetota bacterium]